MIIQKIPYRHIDIEKYQSCVENSVQYTIFAKPEFLSSTNGMKWDCLVYKDYEAVMPVPFVYKMGVKIVTKPWAVQQLGIFSKTDEPSVNQIFLKFLLKNYIVFQYPFNSKNQFIDSGDYFKNNIIAKNDYKNIRAAYSIDRRRNTRILPEMACRIGFHEDNDLAKYQSFYRDYLQGVPSSKKGNFWKVIQCLDTNKLLKIKVLSIDDSPASIAVLLNDEQNLHALLLLNSPQYFRYNAPSILIDQILQEHSSKQNFSFMGGNIPHIAEFFRRFSPVEEQYRLISCSRKVLIMKIIKRFFNC